MTQITNETKLVRVQNAVAAGLVTQNSAAVDLAGFNGVRFIVALGAGSLAVMSTMRTPIVPALRRE